MATTAPTAAPAIADLKPGDRVRCYDAFNATVVRAVAAQDPYVIVRYDHDLGDNVVVYPPYVQSL